MTYKNQIQRHLKKQLGYSLNRYILKNNININNLAMNSSIPQATIINICMGKNYHWADIYKIISILNINPTIGLEDIRYKI